MLGPLEDDQMDAMLNLDGNGGSSSSALKKELSPTTLAGYAAQAEASAASGSRMQAEAMQRSDSGRRGSMLKGKGKEAQSGVPALGNLSRM